MKKIVPTLLVLMPAIIIAQNWDPIRVNDTMNYTHSDSIHITNSIWVNSTNFINGDSIFYLNRVVADVHNDCTIVKRNQPQFLSTFLVKEMPYNIWVAADPYNYLFPVTAGIGAQGSFGNNLTFEITNIDIQDVLGTDDSVKTFSLSDGNEFLLSKNFGLIKFPDFENGGYYTLTGIQNSQYGESIPDFWDIFDFEVEDVFQFSVEGMGGNVFYNAVKKYTVVVKEVSMTGFTYTFDEIYKTVYYGGNNSTVSGFLTINLTFNESENQTASLMPGQLYLIPDGWTQQGTGNVFSRVRLEYDTLLNFPVKCFGIDLPLMEQANYPDLYYELDTASDILNKFSIVDNLFPDGTKGVGYGKGLGEVWRAEGSFEYFFNKRLLGYVKDGDTVGVITPDSVLLVGVRESSDMQNNISVFPNPAFNHLFIHITSDEKIRNYAIELRNLTGEAVLRKDIQNNTCRIDVSALPKGVYVYTVTYGMEVKGRGKVVIF